jgi:endonuclease/exonuclease/phosphatase (EEP) superfamily protein YafD
LKKKKTKILQSLAIANIVLALVCEWDFGVWPLMLTAHFRPHLLGLAVISGVVFALKRRHVLVGLCVLISLLHGRTFIGHLRSAEVLQTNNAPIKFLQFNIMRGNENLSAVENVIRQADADVVVLLEVTPDTWEKLAAVRSMYAFIMPMPRPDFHGLVLMFKRPPRFTTVVSGPPGGEPIGVFALSEIADRHEIVVPHLYSPEVKTGYVKFRQGLDHLAHLLSSMGEHAMIVGDLNTTPWHREFVDFTQRTQFRDERKGKGFLPTYPAALGSLGIPIDHILTKGRFRVRNMQVIADAAGSDHRALLSEVIYTKEETP